MQAEEGQSAGEALSHGGMEGTRPTAAIEIVARANGSPMMFPMLMRLRPY
jgi:hypothetical protein